MVFSDLLVVSQAERDAGLLESEHVSFHTLTIRSCQIRQVEKQPEHQNLSPRHRLKRTLPKAHQPPLAPLLLWSPGDRWACMCDYREGFAELRPRHLCAFLVKTKVQLLG